MNDNDRVWDIFAGLSKYLKDLDSKENDSMDWDHYKDDNPAGYRLINLESKYSDSKKADGPFKVLPLIDGERVPTWRPSFERCTAPKGKFNAFAVIGIGCRWDQYDNAKHSDGGDSERMDVAKKKVFPKFVSDMNAFLNKQKIDGRALKAEIVNGEFQTIRMDFFPYNRYWDGEEPSYYQYIVPLAIRISFA